MKRKISSYSQKVVTVVKKLQTICNIIVHTRMHSVRMRTVRCSGHLGVGGCLPGDVCLGGGGVCLGGVSA